ncbi:hypothetical protein SUGI_0843580 [Cryptomeria japonica]|nr:hypothetical protein SUGI_0843580 [Cryptomeria japonica]
MCPSDVAPAGGRRCKRGASAELGAAPEAAGAARRSGRGRRWLRAQAQELGWEEPLGGGEERAEAVPEAAGDAAGRRNRGKRGVGDGRGAGAGAGSGRLCSGAFGEDGREALTEALTAVRDGNPEDYAVLSDNQTFFNMTFFSSRTLGYFIKEFHFFLLK